MASSSIASETARSTGSRCGLIYFFGPCRLASRVVGAIFLMASVMNGISFTESRPIWNIAYRVLISGELFLGIWLISGTYTVLSGRIAIFILSIFAIINGYQLLNMYSTCGCFGSLHIHPLFTLSLDIVALLLLMQENRYTKKLFKSANLSLKPTYACLTIALIVSGIVPHYLIREPSILSSTSHFIGKRVILEPDSWVGKEFLVAPNIKINANLMSGNWIVILYHRGCSDCTDTLQFYQNTKNVEILKRNGLRLAFVKVDSEETFGGASESDWISWGQLDEAHEWFVNTPTCIVISNGIVQKVSVAEDTRNIQWLQK